MTSGTRAHEFEARLAAIAAATERMLDSLLSPSILPGEDGPAGAISRSHAIRQS